MGSSHVAAQPHDSKAKSEPVSERGSFSDRVRYTKEGSRRVEGIFNFVLCDHKMLKICCGEDPSRSQRPDSPKSAARLRPDNASDRHN